MRPLVSIIIPCLNAAPWLAETLSSCLAQSYQNIEVIYVDNGSTDGSHDIAKGFGCSKVQVLRCECLGASAARNYGLAHAQGDFIQYLDADDLLAADKIEVQLKRLGKEPDGMIASGPWTRFIDNPGASSFDPQPVWNDSSALDFLVSSWRGGGMMPLFSWLSPRKQIETAGAWDERLTTNDDGEYFTRVLLASAGIKFCDKAKGYYRSGISTSLSRRTCRRSVESDFAALQLSCNRLLYSVDSMEVRQACAAAYQRFVYRYFPDYHDLTYEAERIVSSLGGSDLRFDGGRKVQIFCSIFGWKIVRRLQRIKQSKACRNIDNLSAIKPANFT
jgi:glycosyltransferase involved in cell wall biosynthesis